MFMSAIRPAGADSRALSPIHAREELGIYAYVGNDPINFVDPLGLQDEPNCDCDGDGEPDPDIIVTAKRPSNVEYIKFDLGTYPRSYNPFDQFGEGLISWISNGETVCSIRPARPSSGGNFARQTGAVGLGIGDAFTFGLYSYAFSLLPGNDVAAQRQAFGYESGMNSATLLSGLRLAYAGIAKTFTFRSGASAVAARNSLKGNMSGLGSAHPRIYTYQQMLTKYGSDRAVAAAAGRTNPRVNGAAAVGATSGATTGGGC